MQFPANIPLYADRNVAFDATVMFVGWDFTGAAIKMQVRLAPDAPGTPLLDLSTAGSGVSIDYAGTDTVANHIAADRITADQVPTGYTTADDMTLSLVAFSASKAAMALSAVPADENGDPVNLAYDILITPSGGTEDKYQYGAFIVRGTVTQ
jgi:hypothetical protein